jgi:hypothetical protein
VRARAEPEQERLVVLPERMRLEEIERRSDDAREVGVGEHRRHLAHLLGEELLLAKTGGERAQRLGACRRESPPRGEEPAARTQPGCERADDRGDRDRARDDRGPGAAASVLQKCARPFGEIARRL